MAESLDGVDALDSAPLDYQRRADVPRPLTKHIEEGARITARDPKSVLVLVVGRRARAGLSAQRRPELLARRGAFRPWWGTGAGARATTEEYARTRSRTCCSRRAASRKWSGGTLRVTVVSYDFKRRRFVELLGPALHLPLEFVGVAPGGRFDAQSAARGEATAAEAFERDPTAARASSPRSGRRGTPSGASEADGASCPARWPLLDACAKETGPAAAAAFAWP